MASEVGTQSTGTRQAVARVWVVAEITPPEGWERVNSYHSS